jgi:hypothetical protein
VPNHAGEAGWPVDLQDTLCSMSLYVPSASTGRHDTSMTSFLAKEHLWYWSQCDRHTCHAIGSSLQPNSIEQGLARKGPLGDPRKYVTQFNQRLENRHATERQQERRQQNGDMLRICTRWWMRWKIEDNHYTGIKPRWYVLCARSAWRRVPARQCPHNKTYESKAHRTWWLDIDNPSALDTWPVFPQPLGRSPKWYQLGVPYPFGRRALEPVVLLLVSWFSSLVIWLGAIGSAWGVGASFRGECLHLGL